VSVGAVWAMRGRETSEVLLIAEIVEDKIPEAMEAAVVLCEVVRPLPLESKWRLVRHGEDVV
jgi:hypothetical protein